MSNDADKEVPLRPPAKGHPDDKGRTAIELMVSAVPFGGTLTRVVKEMLPTQGDKARQLWEAAITERTNQHSGRIKQLRALGALVEKANLTDEAMANCARDLSYLVFWNDGIRTPLETIASGGGGRGEHEQISRLLEESESDVRTIVDRLRDARDEVVATHRGIWLAQALDKVVWQKIGPGAIRDKLRAFGELDPSDQKLQQNAQVLVSDINDFDEALFRVHEDIRPKVIDQS
jgi:hypothetical protein